MWVSSQVANNLSAKILAGGTNAAQRFVFDAEQGALGGGVMVRTYLNKFSMAGPKTLDIRVHPNMPAGTILMTSKTLPYPLSNVGNVMQIRTRQDYYQIEWPPRARRYESGVYADEVLQHYFPPSMAVITQYRRGVMAPFPSCLRELTQETSENIGLLGSQLTFCAKRVPHCSGISVNDASGTDAW